MNFDINENPIWTKFRNRHESIGMKMVEMGDRDMVGIYRRIGEELALVSANFKCEKCNSTKDIQVHHMILRIHKDYTEFWKYCVNRHYYRNIIILCKKCHASLHNFPENVLTEGMKKDKIIRLKKKYKLDKLKSD